MEVENDLVLEALEILGSKTKLARILEVRLNTVLDWTRGAQPSESNMLRLKNIVEDQKNGKN